MKQVLVVFLALFVFSTSANFWRQCHLTHKPVPTSVTSPQCTDAGCTMTRGNWLTGTVVFTPTHAHAVIETFIRVQPAPGGPWIDLPITTPGGSDTCATMTPGCPTVPGREETFALNLLVPSDIQTFSNANFEIWLAAIAPEIIDVLCFQVTATVI